MEYSVRTIGMAAEGVEHGQEAPYDLKASDRVIVKRICFEFLIFSFVLMFIHAEGFP